MNPLVEFNLYFSVPVDPWLAQSAQVTGIVICHGFIDAVFRQDFSFTDETIKIFGQMQYLDISFEADLVIENFEVMVTVSTIGHDRFNAR